MNDCPVGVLVEFNTTDTDLSSPSSFETSLTKESPAKDSKCMMGNRRNTDDVTFFGLQGRKITSELSMNGVINRSPLCEKLLDITENEPDKERETYQIHGKQNYTLEAECKKQSRSSESSHLCCSDENGLQKGAAHCYQTKTFQNCLPNKTKAVHGSSSSSSKSNLTAVKSGSWSPSMIGREEELLENETFDFDISITPPGSLGIGEDDVFQVLNEQTNEKKVSKKDEIVFKESDAGKSLSYVDISCSLSLEEAVKVRNEASNLVHRLSLKENRTDEKNTNNSGTDFSPGFVNLQKKEELITSGKSTGTYRRRRSRSIASQTNDAALKDDDLPNTRNELEGAYSRKVFTHIESIEDKQKYLGRANQTKKPQGKGRAANRRGNINLRSRPSTAKSVQDKYETRERMASNQVDKDSEVAKKSISVPLGEHINTSTTTSAKTNLKPKIPFVKSSTPICRAANTSANLSNRKIASGQMSSEKSKTETSLSNSQGSKESVSYSKSRNATTSGLKTPNSLSRYHSSSGSSASSLSSSSFLPRKSRLPRALCSDENLSRDQLPVKPQLGQTTSKARGGRPDLKQPITAEISETKLHGSKASGTLKRAPLKAIVPISQMIRPGGQRINKIRNTSNPNQKADSSYKTVTSVHRTSSFPGFGILTPSSKILDISLSSPALTSTPSKSKLTSHSSSPLTSRTNKKGKVTGLPVSSQLQCSKPVII